MEFVKHLGIHPDWVQLRVIVHKQRGLSVPWAIVARVRGNMPVRDQLVVHGEVHCPPGSDPLDVLLAIAGQLTQSD